MTIIPKNFFRGNNGKNYDLSCREFVSNHSVNAVNDSGPSLRKKRKDANIGLRKMARELSISHVYLWDIEHGSRPMPDGLGARFLRALRTLKKPNAGVAV